MLGLAIGVAGPASLSAADTVISMPAPRAKPPARVIVGQADQAAHAAARENDEPVTTAQSPAPIQSAYASNGSATAEAAANNITEGDIALYRYSGARRGTFDTYFNDGSYLSNGIRVYTYPHYYPQFVWGPFWGWGWGGFGFPFCR
jgi:hypothetical protein